ncbi:mediator of RNA polymerase II transcription subunit 22 isoform X2 [Delphinus delphis]|uniref:mediator of RNA polymerase II transcription subunit 22 isoform X2 n=1 Tax=Delphinus delphis TaxID=9728 RepID=UPI0028C4D281|nr:mediator of RNA polymerase II transcription subunit 22 isoform X2 [Delphinus delphis]XP_059869793.1 mediator of RNA polymerase II transcription subunit 22 isoform X2 [Delphinus delphis]
MMSSPSWTTSPRSSRPPRVLVMTGGVYLCKAVTMGIIASARRRGEKPGKTSQIEDETQVSRATQGEQDNYEMHVRAANIVRAGESLMKLVSDLKQFLILNDFPSVNEAIDERSQQLRALQEECDRKLIALRDEVSTDLYELEEEYYSSSSSLCEANDLPLCEAYWRLDLDTDSADGLSVPLPASPEPSAGPLQGAAPAHSHAGGPGPAEHA